MESNRRNFLKKLYALPMMSLLPINFLTNDPSRKDYIFMAYEPFSNGYPNGATVCYKFKYKDLKKMNLISNKKDYRLQEPFKDWKLADIAKLHRKLYKYENIEIIPEEEDVETELKDLPTPSFNTLEIDHKKREVNMRANKKIEWTQSDEDILKSLLEKGVIKDKNYKIMYADE